MENNNSENLNRLVPIIGSKEFINGHVGNKWKWFIPEINEQVISFNLERTIQDKLGISAREWFRNRVLLAYGDKNGNHYCPICGKLIGSGKFFYTDGRCDNPECHKIFRSISATIKNVENYKENPSIKKKISNTLKDTYKGNPELHEKLSESTRKGLDTDESRKRRSEAHRKIWANPTDAMLNPKGRGAFIPGGNGSYAGTKNWIYSPYEERDICLDSMWERKFFIECMRNPDIVRIKRCPFGIQYLNPKDNEFHAYVPDFLIEYSDGTLELAEIKPEYKFEFIETIVKMKAGIEFCNSNFINYKMYTENNYDFSGSKKYLGLTE